MEENSDRTTGVGALLCFACAFARAHLHSAHTHTTTLHLQVEKMATSEEPWVHLEMAEMAGDQATDCSITVFC